MQQHSSDSTHSARHSTSPLPSLYQSSSSAASQRTWQTKAWLPRQAAPIWRQCATCNSRLACQTQGTPPPSQTCAGYRLESRGHTCSAKPRRGCAFLLQPLSWTGSELHWTAQPTPTGGLHSLLWFFRLGELLPESTASISPATTLMWGDVAIDNPAVPGQGLSGKSGRY